MTLITTTQAGISARTQVYAETNMLAHAAPVTILEKFGKTIRMPKNKGVTIKFRRPKTFSAATTPLVEGITPGLTAFEYEDVTAVLKQYGQVVSVTDWIEDTHEDPVLADATAQAGENIGRTVEALTYAVVRAGTNVFYANGSSRAAVNSVITLAKQRAVVRALKAQKAQKVTSILSSSPNYATRAIEAAYVAVAHTDLESDIRALAGFIPVASYGQRAPISEAEIGSVEDVRYLLSPDLEPFLGAGGATTTMVNTAGNADVYPVMYFGKDAFGVIAVRGAGAVSPSVIPVGQKTKDDPLGQRGFVGWKTWFVSVRLNEMWMARLEVAVTLL